MEKVIYSNKGGLGIILDHQESESDFFINNEFLINGTIIKSGDFTDLFGLFDKQVRFAGALIDDPKCMVFYLGNDLTLFESMKYYSCWYWIAENRLVNKYQEGTARDMLYVNGKWK